jgi:undecaprenyl-diphosphatase
MPSLVAGSPTLVADLLKALVLGVVEGVTEFLPISSTGHLILAGNLLDFRGPLTVTFEIFIQLGAVLAVVWLFRADLWARTRRLPTSAPDRHFALVILIAFLPAALVGLALHDQIERHLFSPLPVALAQLVGAGLIWLAESRNRLATVEDLDHVGRGQALVTGVAQVLSLWPGMSRAGATTVGGMLSGLDRVTATRFSFYLAIPTLGMAGLYALAKHANQIAPADALVLAVGFVTSFAVALITIRALLRFVAHHSLMVFAWYRVALGLAVLALVALGVMRP